jgi:ribonuclease P protein component
MLPKVSRLTAGEVRAILKEGKSVRTPSLLAKYGLGSSAKIAVVVSKKIARKAIQRNAIRRSVYHSLPQALPSKKHVAFLVLKYPADYAPDIKIICSKLT